MVGVYTCIYTERQPQTHPDRQTYYIYMCVCIHTHIYIYEALRLTTTPP